MAPIITIFPEKKMSKLTVMLSAIAMVSSFMNTHIVFSQISKGTGMECKLTLEKGIANVGDLVVAEVELKNTSKEELKIVYDAAPFEYLNLIVLDPKGNKISNKHYGSVFSPSETKTTLKLAPGEVYKHTVNIQSNSEKGAWSIPGKYKITAVFEYDKIKSVSMVAELTLNSK